MGDNIDRAASGRMLMMVGMLVTALLVQLWFKDVRFFFFAIVLGGMSTLASMAAFGGLYADSPWETLIIALEFDYYVLWRATHRYINSGGRPLFPGWTFPFEVVRNAVRFMTDRYGTRLLLERNAKLIRYQSECLGVLLEWLPCRKHGRIAEKIVVNGMEHLWLKLTNPSKSAKRYIILYYHGGGYATLSPRMYVGFCIELTSIIASELAKTDPNAPQIDVVLANYRKTPEYQFPIPAEDAVAMYQYLIEKEGIPAKRIILVGDSAGGGLVMSTLLRTRDNQMQLPLCAIVLSPYVDLTGDENPEAGQHCSLGKSFVDSVRKCYHPTVKDPMTWQDASAVQCDLRGLPPVLIQTGTLDYIHQHALRLYKKAEADGVAEEWELDVHEHMIHIFSIFPAIILPGAKLGIDRMAVFAARQIRKENKDHS